MILQYIGLAKERWGHASTIITSDGHTVMAVIGGRLCL